VASTSADGFLTTSVSEDVCIQSPNPSQIFPILTSDLGRKNPLLTTQLLTTVVRKTMTSIKLRDGDITLYHRRDSKNWQADIRLPDGGRHTLSLRTANEKVAKDKVILI
jgi:hypothetical protein